MDNNKQDDVQIIRIKEVMGLTGLPRSSVYRLSDDPDEDFPKKVSLGSTAVGWVKAEITGWIKKRIANR
ncbi:AlpA family phage regulatory protein [Vibrio mediterranei]